jgi:hypothetical protein
MGSPKNGPSAPNKVGRSNIAIPAAEAAVVVKNLRRAMVALLLGAFMIDSPKRKTK